MSKVFPEKILKCSTVYDRRTTYDERRETNDCNRLGHLSYSGYLKKETQDLPY